MADSSEVLEILSPTGQMLRGQRWGDGVNLVVLVHAPGGDLDSWGPFPLYLAASGLAVVAFDLPGHGLSDNPWKPELLADSVRAVVAWARRQHATRVFIVAAEASIFGTLQLSAQGAVDALVALSPPAISDDRDHIDGLMTALPKLLLVGAGQERELLAAQRFSRRCMGWTVLSTLPTSRQGTDLLTGPWSRQASEQIVSFLRDYQVFGGRTVSQSANNNEGTE